MNIEKVAVIGAGVMGAAIAAHVANAGVQVYLLDIVPPDAGRRNAVAERALDHLLQAEPAPFMDQRSAKRITPGNLEDNLDWLAGVDWVIEAIIEDAQAKTALYQKLHAVCREDTLISSNTSTLPLRLLTQGMPEAFCRRFMITHFFNPPRYMRLLELVSGPQTRPELAEAVGRFADLRLGKTCVVCHDTPGFIGNRVGMYWLQSGLLEAMELGLSVEEADAVLSAPVGIPKTGVFGLLDLIGLDLIPRILGAMKLALPPEDAFQAINRTPELVRRLIADGYTGRKGKGGFYRLNKTGKETVKESVDLATGLFKPSGKPELDSVEAARLGGIRALLAHGDKTSVYAWRVLSGTLAYAASLVPEICDDIVGVDEAMRLGYHWQYGPFELLDLIGVDEFAGRLRGEGRPVPPLLQSGQAMYRVAAGKAEFKDVAGGYQPVKRKPGVLLLADIKRQGPPLLENASASLWDIGDGVVCLEFHSKMNTLDLDSMALIGRSLETVRRGYLALVIYNEGENFSAGANLNLLVAAIHNQAWDEVAYLIEQGQSHYQAIKYAPFPVVAAPSGLALGGGCEILLHCSAVQAHAELYTGLVEVGVGLIPGWGGCKEYLRRCLEQPQRFGGPIPPLSKAFTTIGTAKVSKSAAEARNLSFLAPSDGITMNRDRLLADAKAKALALCPGYAPPQPALYPLPGKTAKVGCIIALQAMRLLGKATAYDMEVGLHLAEVLSGGACDITKPLAEADLLGLERTAFVQLCQQPGTLARLEHLLKTGKPLRN